MDLKDIITSIRSYEGITRKNMIKEVTDILKDSYNIAGKTVLGFGDDASAVDIGNNQLVLLATDGMWGKLMEADPWWAGYCSVLVNVNDIAAMGGIPMGMTNVLSVKDSKTCKKIMEGINEGVLKFGVPMVGGHLHPDTPYNALDVSITGIINKDDVITSSGAQVGDKVIVAMDLDGKPHEKFPLNWDTTTFKSPELVQDQIKAMNRIAKRHLVTAGKDISNPGILGTLGMLLETSDVGASIEVEKIPRNERVTWEDWLKVYPGSGFVLTAPAENVQETVELLDEVNVTGKIVGDVTGDRILYVWYKGEKEVLFDFNRDRITGVKEKS